MSKALTNLENFLDAYNPGNNDSLENRLDLYPFFKLAMKYKQSGKVLPEETVQDYLKYGWDDTRTISYPLIDNLITTINAGKLANCEASVTSIDTAIGTLTSVDFNWAFTMKVADSYVNTVGYKDEFITKFESGNRGFIEVLNTLVNTEVEAVANTFFPAALQAKYWPDNVAGDAFLIPNSELSTLYNKLRGVMREMNMDTVTGKWDVLATTDHYTDIENFLNQGISNDTNTGYQYRNFNFEMETELAEGEAVNGAAMVMVPNTFGLWNTNAPDVNANSMTTDGKKWSIVQEPLSGMDVGSLFSSKCVAAESIESFQYYTRVTFVSKYNSDPATRFSPWLKLEIDA